MRSQNGNGPGLTVPEEEVQRLGTKAGQTKQLMLEWI